MMEKTLLKLLLCTLVSSASAKRDPKFFGLFNIVSFPNNKCNTTDGKTGICYTNSECQEKKGNPAGSCAHGFGSCCAFVHSCSIASGLQTLDNKIDYLENENYPSVDKEQSNCVATIQPINRNICQIRFDFEDFDMDGGSVPNKPCDRDRLEISGGTQLVKSGALCGFNSGRHLYIPVQEGMGGATVRIMTSVRDGADFTVGYKWKIKVTQIDCTAEEDKALVAPEGCSQYHTGSDGVVSSYNRGSVQKIQYPLNLDYAICFKIPDNACEIQFKRDPALPPLFFSVGKMSTTKYLDAICGKENGCGPDACISLPTDTVALQAGDYLLIPGGFRTIKPVLNTPETFKNEDYFCGAGVGYDTTSTTAIADGTGDGPGVLTKVVGPVLIRFHSDDKPGLNIGPQPTDPANTAELRDELGFSLMYKFQSTCTATV